MQKLNQKHLLTERLVKDKKRIYNLQLFFKKKYYLLTKSLAKHQRNYYVTMLMIQVSGLFLVFGYKHKILLLG